MASLTKDHKGSYRVMYTIGGERHAIRIGKVPDSVAQQFCEKLGAISATIELNCEPSADIIRWFGGLSPAMRKKLNHLIAFEEPKPEKDASPTLAALFKQHADTISSISTKRNYSRIADALVAYFGASKTVASVTFKDAIEWRMWMMLQVRRNGKRRYSENTIRRYTSTARTVFKRAAKFDYISRNPWDDQSLPVSVGTKEKPYVTVAQINEAIDAMPTAEWRAVLILARFAGMRIQSEGPQLEWSHVNWDKRTLYIARRKTGQRIMPLMPEFRNILWELHEAAEPGEVYILPTLRKKPDWRGPLNRMLYRAGIEPWPSLLNSLRASAGMDIAKAHGAENAVKWLGHSLQTFLTYYHSTPDHVLEKASEVGIGQSVSDGQQTADVR